MDETLTTYFEQLDKHLSELGQCDSTIEYAPHARKPFDLIIRSLNEIKTCLGVECKNIDSYFGKDDENQ